MKTCFSSAEKGKKKWKLYSNTTRFSCPDMISTVFILRQNCRSYNLNGKDIFRLLNQISLPVYFTLNACCVMTRFTALFQERE